MKSKPEIEITEGDVQILLEDQYEIFKNITANEIYCVKCNKGYTGGIVNYKITLNNLNDIILSGTCSLCGNPVRRYLEFGENKDFSERADLLRKAIENIKNINKI